MAWCTSRADSNIRDQKLNQKATVCDFLPDVGASVKRGEDEGCWSSHVRTSNFLFSLIASAVVFNHSPFAKTLVTMTQRHFKANSENVASM